jgi:hypothetical protein
MHATTTVGEKEYGIHPTTREFFCRPANWRSLTNKLEAAWKKVNRGEDYIPDRVVAELVTA